MSCVSCGKIQRLIRYYMDSALFILEIEQGIIGATKNDGFNYEK